MNVLFFDGTSDGPSFLKKETGRGLVPKHR